MTDEIKDREERMPELDDISQLGKKVTKQECKFWRLNSTGKVLT